MRCCGLTHTSCVQAKVAMGEQRAQDVPLVTELFAMFDADGDGKLSKAEYKNYLSAVGLWGSGNCTDQAYDKSGWPEECKNLSSSRAEGVGWEAFDAILYGKYRLGMAQADLNRCKQTVVASTDMVQMMMMNNMMQQQNEQSHARAMERSHGNQVRLHSNSVAGGLKSCLLAQAAEAQREEA